MKDNLNVLLVFADQWTYWALGCNGNREVATPHLDRFAASGLNCVNACSGTPVCTPARASLITGLRPDRHGLFLNDVPLDPDFPGIGKHFRDAGYATAWVGKWHVDGRGRYAYIPKDRRHGFEYFKALECTHDYNHSRYYDNDDPEVRVWSGYDVFAQTDDLIDWIDSCPEDQPFFGVLSWGPPHNPYHTAPDEYRVRYAADQLTPRGNVPESHAANAREVLAGYYAHCTALDDAFGKLMQALEERGLDENTIVVFTSDHGDMLRSHGLGEKQKPWDESLRVPMLLRGPMLPAGSESPLMIELFDLWPTLAGLAGHPVTQEIHARDLSGNLVAGTSPEDDAAYYSSYARFGTWVKKTRAARRTLPEPRSTWSSHAGLALRRRPGRTVAALRSPSRPAAAEQPCDPSRPEIHPQ